MVALASHNIFRNCFRPMSQFTRTPLISVRLVFACIPRPALANVVYAALWCRAHLHYVLGIYSVVLFLPFGLVAPLTNKIVKRAAWNRPRVHIGAYVSYSVGLRTREVGVHVLQLVRSIRFGDYCWLITIVFSAGDICCNRLHGGDVSFYDIRLLIAWSTVYVW